MKNTLILISLAIVLLLIYVSLKYSMHHKRKKEKKHNDPLKLKPRKIGNRFTFKSTDIDDTIIQMIETLKSHGGQLTHQIKHVAIVYLGENTAFKFNGLINTPITELPLRIVITTNAHDDAIFVRIEEDYGFQMFAGPIKAAFRRKYHDAFTFYHGLLSGCLV